MKALNNYQFWFITGSQDLYGEEVLQTVKEHSEKIVAGLNGSDKIICPIVFKTVVATSDEIAKVIKDANHDDSCAGIITWMHTFSPSKMWIRGLALLQKPYLHLHTQFNRKIPNEGIDMDFMNLNQAAHGDREHGFIGARMRLARKIVVGFWEDAPTQEKIGGWMRSAVGVAVSKTLKIARFGDNMRDVAVTEGDKVESEIKLGWSVNYHPVGDLVEILDKVTEAEIDAKMDEYKTRYEMDTDDIDAVRYQAKEEIAMQKFLGEGGFGAYTNTFQDLHGMRQLPGLASQRLMEDGYGFGPEGDWKTSGLVHIMKAMTQDLGGGVALMEDYTYDFATAGSAEDDEVLASHMLEICPSIAADKPKVRVYPLGIGDKEPPARLVFEGKPGSAICVSLIDMGGRMRMICQEVEVVKPKYTMPNLPVARVMWKPMPDLQTSAECWILAGGAHHTSFSYDLTAEHMRDFAEILGLEFVHIGKDTCPVSLRKELMVNDLVWNLK